MHERLLDKNIIPTEKQINEYMGENAVENCEFLIRTLKKKLK